MNKADVGLGFIVATPWGLNFIAIELGIEGVPRFSMLSLVVWSYGLSLLPMILISLSIEGTAVWQAAFSNFNLTSAGSVI